MLDSIAYVINAIWGVFTSIGLNDIVDIAILSFLIFHGIKLIRETRAQQLTKGILILIGCYLLAVFFNLQTIRFLLRICFQWGFLALIIMFQPELRRVLEKVGRTSLGGFNFFSSSISDEELALKCMEYTGTKELAERPVNEVSGGQKQRILLAKVLAQQTPILFLDEPTTGLDMVYQEEIFRFSKALAEMGKTILMVVHELNLAAKYCSRIILLGEGTVIADGRPDNVFTEKILSKAYNAPVRVIRSHNTNEIIEISTKEDNGRCQRDKELLELICCKGSIC